MGDRGYGFIENIEAIMNEIRAHAHEYPDGQKFFCIVWDNDVTKEYIIHRSEAEEFLPDMRLKKAIKLIAIERFRDEEDS